MLWGKTGAQLVSAFVAAAQRRIFHDCADDRPDKAGVTLAGNERECRRAKSGAFKATKKAGRRREREKERF